MNNTLKHRHSDTDTKTYWSFFISTLSIMALSIMTLSIMTLNIMTLCIMTLSIMTLSIMILSIQLSVLMGDNNTMTLCCVSLF